MPIKSPRKYFQNWEGGGGGQKIYDGQYTHCPLLNRFHWTRSFMELPVHFFQVIFFSGKKRILPFYSHISFLSPTCDFRKLSKWTQHVIDTRQNSYQFFFLFSIFIYCIRLLSVFKWLTQIQVVTLLWRCGVTAKNQRRNFLVLTSKNDSPFQILRWPKFGLDQTTCVAQSLKKSKFWVKNLHIEP